MTLSRRIIPVFDLAKGRVVKGIRMGDVNDAADPVDVALAFEKQGADEITMIDVSTGGNRGEVLEQVLQRVSAKIFIPITAGGGVRDRQDIKRMLAAGADRVMLNTAAILNPDLVLESVEHFGSESLVGAIDVKYDKKKDRWEVMSHGGRKATGMDARMWLQKLADYGIGEVVVTSLDRDGSRKGFDVELVRTMGKISPVPLVVAGGAGEAEDIAAVLSDNEDELLADGVMVASIFHSGKVDVGSVKEFLAMRGIEVRQ
ncbi:MAG: imidazole glycerol phosphate synthase cyclase subunit [Gammaproteobacteria bacterium]|nr:imidazole glycerol phosphate synthase cyclase subunit [Gammaproteobacteria bacterium]